MKNQSLFQQKLLDKVFVYTAETTPPDASNKEILLKNVMPLKELQMQLMLQIVQVQKHICRH